MGPRVLVIDDDPTLCELLAMGLGKTFEVVTRTSAEKALQLLGDEPFEVVVTDLNMRETGGLEVCRRSGEIRPDVPVVVITAFGSFESAIAAIRAGAYDYVTKPFEVEALAHTLMRAAQHRALCNEVRRLQQETAKLSGLGELIGDSPAMKRVHDLLARVAGADASVLITGESGTGKELVARALHRSGPRRDGPFVAVNCAAMPEALLESELFGHVRGAFTDARATKPGLFVEASGGSLFLDEIGEMPLGLQPKLLRALQERKIRPVGANAEMSFDARIVAATNKDLELAVQEGRFREDLYYRLNVIELPLPPLRVRGTDVMLLAQYFLQRFASASHKAVVGLSPAVAERLLAYPWPGNVRELQNCIERAVALARLEHLTVDDLPDRVRAQSQPRASGAAGEGIVTLEELERRHILHVLERVGGNRTLAAQLLGVDRKTLYRKLERYGAAVEKS